MLNDLANVLFVCSISVYTRTHIYIHIYMYIYIHIYIYTFTYIHICMYVHACVIYVYIGSAYLVPFIFRIRRIHFHNMWEQFPY